MSAIDSETTVTKSEAYVDKVKKWEGTAGEVFSAKCPTFQVLNPIERETQLIRAEKGEENYTLRHPEAGTLEVVSSETQRSYEIAPENVAYFQAAESWYDQGNNHLHQVGLPVGSSISVEVSQDGSFVWGSRRQVSLDKYSMDVESRRLTCLDPPARSAGRDPRSLYMR